MHKKLLRTCDCLFKKHNQLVNKKLMRFIATVKLHIILDSDIDKSYLEISAEADL
jgi:hypothetical protein